MNSCVIIHSNTSTITLRIAALFGPESTVFPPPVFVMTISGVLHIAIIPSTIIGIKRDSPGVTPGAGEALAGVVLHECEFISIGV